MSPLASSYRLMNVVSAAIFNDLIGWTVFAIILGMMALHSSLERRHQAGS